MTYDKTFLASRPIAKWLLCAGLASIPFDAIRGTSALGELGNELSFFFFAPAIALAFGQSLIDRRGALLDSLVLRIAAVIMAVIVVSFLFNAPSIVTGVFRERSAFGKFATSLMVIAYGLALAWLVEHTEKEEVATVFSRFISFSAFLTMAYLPFEWVGERGYLGGIYTAIDGFVHSRQADLINAWDGSLNNRVAFHWDTRLRSVSFEPPAFGNYTGFAWPWVWYSALRAPPPRRILAWTGLAAFTIIILILQSRTGVLMLAVNAATILLLYALYANNRSGEAVAAARVLVPVFALILSMVGALYALDHYEDIITNFVSTDSVSNLSRWGFQVAGYRMFFDHPVFGFGLGQFGIHVADFLPSWEFRSPEARPMIVFPEAPWPAAFSLFSRLGAELGIFGLIGWIGLWIGLAVMLARRARRARATGDGRVDWHYPVILNCVGVLASSFASDTFRTPMFWVALGLGCAIIAREPLGAKARARVLPPPRPALARSPARSRSPG